MRALAGILLVIAVAVMFTAVARSSGDPYLGIWHEVSDDPPGLRIQVVPGAPAELADLQNGDVLIALAGAVLADSDKSYAEQLRVAVADLEIGDVLNFTVIRDTPEIAVSLNGEVQSLAYPLEELSEIIGASLDGDTVELVAVRNAQELVIPVTLGARPDTTGEPFALNSELPCSLPDAHPEVRELLAELSHRARIEDDNSDLQERLYNRASPDDDYKLSRVVYLLRDGLKGEALALAVSDQLAAYASTGVGGFAGAQAYAGELMDVSGLYAKAPVLRTGLTAEEHLDVLQLILNTAAVYIQGAFADFSDEEMQFISEQRSQLTEVFAAHHYVDTEDDDPRRIDGNLRLIELAKRIDYEQLMLAQLTLAQLADSSYLAGLKDDLCIEFADRLLEEDLLVRETPLGRLVISGAGHSWRSGEAPALLIDLGGDDFYTTTAGSGTSPELPASVLIEFGGDDAYESTEPYSQGCGSLGCGLLIDCSGDDQYIGLRWAQGSGFFGCGALLDLAGDDIYRSSELSQAAAIFGTGLLIDFAGNDHLEGQMKCQAFGGARGIGLLIDVAGDDLRYCKGKYPTGYGDAGIFDAWGQACAQGFRGIASGGIAAIIDLGGEDENEAGNFSQGGGYYFGFGFFHDRGWEDDYYLGSRYAQGFCAHQAIGVFLESGGDDVYDTRQAVAQGLAWDECCTMFVDYGGDDTYHGGTGFSQGASAHNAVCVMWDRGGRDNYIYPAGQARAGGNDYHGGTSLSLFIDEGGEVDFYDSSNSGNDKIAGWPEHGFFADLPGTLLEALTDGGWRDLWTGYE